jgi:hypothetical protein
MVKWLRFYLQKRRDLVRIQSVPYFFVKFVIEGSIDFKIFRGSMPPHPLELCVVKNSQV